MSAFSYNFHIMESICGEIALLSGQFSEQVISQLIRADTLLDPEIKGKVTAKFNAAMSQAQNLRGGYGELAELIRYAAGLYKKTDREAVDNLTAINSDTRQLLDNLQKPLQGVGPVAAVAPNGVFTVTPEGFLKALPSVVLTPMSAVASFEILPDTIKRSLREGTPVRWENLAAYGARNPVYTLLFPGAMRDGTAAAPVFTLNRPAPLATGGAWGSWAFLSLTQKARETPELERHGLTEGKIKNIFPNKGAEKWFPAAAAITVLAFGALVTAKGMFTVKSGGVKAKMGDLSGVTAKAGEKEEAGRMAGQKDSRPMERYWAGTPFLPEAVSAVAPLNFPGMEAFKMIIDPVSREIPLREYYKIHEMDPFEVIEGGEGALAGGGAGKVHEMDPFEVIKGGAGALAGGGAGKVHEMDPFEVIEGSEGWVASRAYLDVHEIDPFKAIKGGKVESKNGVYHDVPELNPFKIIEGGEVEIKGRNAAASWELQQIYRKKTEEIKTQEKKPVWELEDFVAKKGLNIDPASRRKYDVAALTALVFPDSDDSLWSYVHRDKILAEQMRAFDIRVRIPPVNYGYLQKFTTIAGSSGEIAGKAMLAVKPLSGYRAKFGQDAEETASAQWMDVQNLDQLAISDEVFDSIWKHAVYLDGSFSGKEAARKDWEEIRAGHVFSDDELDVGEQYQSNLSDDIFTFLAKYAPVPELAAIGALAGEGAYGLLGNSVEVKTLEVGLESGGDEIGDMPDATQVYRDELTGLGVQPDESGTVSEAVRAESQELQPETGEIADIMAQVSGARVVTDQSELNAQFKQWKIVFTGNVYKPRELSGTSTEKKYMSARTGAKVEGEQDIEPVAKNSANSIIISRKEEKSLDLTAPEMQKEEAAELDSDQIKIALSVLSGAIVGTGAAFALQKAAAAAHQKGEYAISGHDAFEFLQRNWVAATKDVLKILAKNGWDFVSVALTVDGVCNGFCTQGDAVSAVVTYASVGTYFLYKTYKTYKG